MTKPLSPSDVESAKAKTIPPQIIETANALIAERWNGREATFTLHELGKRARDKLGMDPKTDFEDGHLDIEPIFRKAGWVVEFDRPGYNETYDARFTFRKRKTRRGV